jgi:hypothetical protein
MKGSTIKVIPEGVDTSRAVPEDFWYALVKAVGAKDSEVCRVTLKVWIPMTKYVNRFLSRFAGSTHAKTYEMSFITHQPFISLEGRCFSK